MRQKIRVGLVQGEWGWQRILTQEGIPFAQAKLSKEPREEDFAAIVLNRQLKEGEKGNLLRFLQKGGAALTTAGYAKQLLPELDFELVPKSPLQPKGRFFHGAGLLWLNKKIAFFPGKEPGQPLEARIGRGFLLVIPFDPNSATLERGYEKRAFHSRKAFPGEFASKTSKAAVRTFVRNCLLRLFERRQLPFVHLWYYPKRFESAFCFHVDLDYLNQDTIAAIRLFKRLGIEPAWFLNTQAAKGEEAKPVLQKVLQQRFLGQHGSEHSYWQDDLRSEGNALLGHREMQSLGREPKAFCAPNGVWNQGVGRAAQSKRYSFAIAFSLDHDNLPFNPIVGSKKSKVLLIPTHPICIGLLKRYDFSGDEMGEYFLSVIERNLDANLPILFYSHPFKEIARFPEVIEGIAAAIKSEKEIWLTNYFAFADWWNKRQKSAFSIEFNGKKVLLKAKCPADASFALVRSGKRFLFPATSKSIGLAELANGKQLFASFLQDTEKRPSALGPRHRARSIAGKGISLIRRIST